MTTATDTTGEIDWEDILSEASAADEDGDDSNDDVEDEQVEDADGDDDESDEDEDVDDAEGDDQDDEGDEPEANKETPQTYTVKVQGQEVEVSLDELLGGYMRTADYTRKTQEAAADRAAAEAYRNFEEQLRANPAATLDTLRKQLGLGDEVDLESLDPFERELHELKQWRAQQEAREATRAQESARERVLAELATVKQTFDDPDLDDDELLLFAAENQILDLTLAYRAMTFDKKTATKTAADEAERQKQARIAAKRRAPKVAPGSKRSARTRAKGASDDLSIEEALAETLAELR